MAAQDKDVPNPQAGDEDTKEQNAQRIAQEQEAAQQKAGREPAGQAPHTDQPNSG